MTRRAKANLTGLPPKCYTTLKSTGELVEIERYAKDYVLSPFSSEVAWINRMMAERMNQGLGVSKAEEAAMHAGVIFGWQSPVAQPKAYDRQGKRLVDSAVTGKGGDGNGAK